MATDYDYGVGGVPTVGYRGMLEQSGSGEQDPLLSSFNPADFANIQTPPQTQSLLSNSMFQPQNYQNMQTLYNNQPLIDETTYEGRARQYGLQQAGQYAQSQNALNEAVSASERAGMGIGMYGAAAGYNLGAKYLNRDADLARQKLALQVQGNQVDVGANARQPGYLTGLHGLALGDLNAQAGQQRRGLESDLTGRGAFTSVGGQQGRFDIAQSLLRGTQGENIQYGERMARTEDEKQKLDLAAKDLGINGQQLESDLQKGLERLGLDRDMTVSDLLNQMNSSVLQDAARAQSTYQDALTHGDYFARLAPGQTRVTGGAS